MSNREFNEKRTGLANEFAAAGARLLDYMGTGGALAAIPNTEPQQYVVAGTLQLIAKLLPAESVPPLTAPAPLTDERIQYLAEFHAIESREFSTKQLIKFVRTVEREIRAKAAPAAPAQTAETEISDRLRRIVTTIGEGSIAVTSKLLLQAADECDRFYNGMMNWKANAQAKDRTIIELRENAKAAPVQTAELTQIDNPLPPQGFIDYVTKNYTGDVFFADPAWHALKLWNAAMRHVAAPVQAEQAQPNSAEFDGIKTVARNEVLAEVEREITTCFARGGPPDDPHPDAEIYNQGVQSALECVRAIKAEAPAQAEQVSARIADLEAQLAECSALSQKWAAAAGEADGRTEKARNEVLEEAARECLRHTDTNPHYGFASRDCADAIRALKTPACAERSGDHA